IRGEHALPAGDVPEADHSQAIRSCETLTVWRQGKALGCAARSIELLCNLAGGNIADGHDAVAAGPGEQLAIRAELQRADEINAPIGVGWGLRLAGHAPLTGVFRIGKAAQDDGTARGTRLVLVRIGRISSKLGEPFAVGRNSPPCQVGLESTGELLMKRVVSRIGAPHAEAGIVKADQ